MVDVWGIEFEITWCGSINEFQKKQKRISKVLVRHCDSHFSPRSIGKCCGLKCDIFSIKQVMKKDWKGRIRSLLSPINKEHQIIAVFTKQIRLLSLQSGCISLPQRFVYTFIGYVTQSCDFYRRFSRILSQTQPLLLSLCWSGIHHLIESLTTPFPVFRLYTT